jgi:RHS repeat-associated protein
MNTGGNAYYYLYDSLGSVVNLTSSAGATEWTYAYEPFGTLRTQTQNDPSAPTNLMQFTGELFDPASGLFDLRARQYDPTDGRFISVDPARDGDLLDLSGYIYGKDNPGVYTDPTGMYPSCSKCRKEGDFGYIETQVHANGALLWGAYPWEAGVGGVWTAQIWVNGKAFFHWWIFPIPKVQLHPPHGSIVRKNAPSGATIHIFVTYAGKGIAYGNLWCVMPLWVPAGSV